MNERYSVASKSRWAQVPPEVRKKRMSLLAKSKWNKMSDEDKSAHGRMMRSKVARKKNI